MVMRPLEKNLPDYKKKLILFGKGRSGLEYKPAYISDTMITCRLTETTAYKSKKYLEEPSLAN